MQPVRCCPSDRIAKNDWKKSIGNGKRLVNAGRFREAGSLLKALGHPLRLRILLLLLVRDCCVCEIVSALDKKQNLVSHNLGILRRHGIIEAYRRSSHKYYRLKDGAIGMIEFIKKDVICKRR